MSSFVDVTISSIPEKNQYVVLFSFKEDITVTYQSVYEAVRTVVDAYVPKTSVTVPLSGNNLAVTISEEYLANSYHVKYSTWLAGISNKIMYNVKEHLYDFFSKYLPAGNGPHEATKWMIDQAYSALFPLLSTTMEALHQQLTQVIGDVPKSPYNNVSSPTSFSGLAAQLPGVDETVKYPCTCYPNTSSDTLFRVIIHLNDICDWTREAIADWVESLDVDTRFKTKEELADRPKELSITQAEIKGIMVVDYPKKNDKSAYIDALINAGIVDLAFKAKFLGEWKDPA